MIALQPPKMINLTKFNNDPIVLNALFIERIEPTPDTVITLISGKKLLVKETTVVVKEMVTQYYKEIGMFTQVTAKLLHQREEGDGDE